MAFVTIGIPFYNAEKTLAGAIRSVFAQTHRDWELILLDDGSTDRSLEIARSVNDPRVRVISDGKNLKLAKRLNQMVDEAKYDYIARMDADDLMSTERIELELKEFEKNPNLDVVSTGVCSLSQDDQPLGYRCHNNNVVTPYEVLTHKNGAGIVHAAILARKSWYLRNLYNSKYDTSQDADLWLKAFYHQDFSHLIIRKPLYYYRESGNVTPRKILNGTRYLLMMLKEYGAGILSFSERMKCRGLLYFKLFIINILVITGQLKRLLAIRNNHNSDENMYRMFCEDIRKINRTNVPGLIIE